MKKKIFFFVALILLIELSGYGIIASLYKLFGSIN